MKLFGNFSSKWPVLTHENSTLFINFPLKWGFLNFLSFPSFQVGSIAHKRNQETMEIFEFLKALNLASYKLSNTLPKYDIQETLRIWIPYKPQKAYFFQIITIAPSVAHCFLQKNSLSRWNFLEFFVFREDWNNRKFRKPHFNSKLVNGVLFSWS